ncbi:MAG: TIGR01777 family oxidoreductase [Candidatus Eisenbacteria bacterium]
MPEYTRKSRLLAPVESVFAWHERVGAFERLAPPWVDVRVVSRTGSIRDGDQLPFVAKQGPLRFRWQARHQGYQENRQFGDVARRSPFRAWEHIHRFEPDDSGASFLEDIVHWQLPLGRAGALGHRAVEHELERLFTFRHERTRQDLKRHLEMSGEPWRILLSGASGLVGRQLIAFLTSGGHDVTTLVRRTPRNTREIRWDPMAGQLEPNALEGFDAVIHLSGEDIAGGRWTEARKRKIVESRTRSTTLLAGHLARCARKPRVLLSASAIGYYGHRGEETLTEESPAGDGFLADTCRAWEGATAPASDAGIRVAHVRIGIVLAAAGGALRKMLPAWQLGLGGPIGSGEQVFSWIALDDLIGIFHFLLRAEGVHGPVNATAPKPETNEDFATILAEVLQRPCWARIPEQAIELLVGEMGTHLLLRGARILPSRLAQAGFQFLWPELDGALRFELGRMEES